MKPIIYDQQSNFDLQSFFVHPTLLLTAVNSEAKSRIETALKKAANIPQPYSGSFLQSVFSDETKRFIITNRVPALEELLITAQELESRYVTVERAFYFKGLPKAARAKLKNLPPEYVEFKAVLLSMTNYWRVSLRQGKSLKN